MSKKIQRPINPKTGKEYSRSWTYRIRHPDKAEEHRAFMRTPEQLKKSSIRGLKNKEHLRKVKLDYYHKHKDRLKEARIKIGKLTKERLHSNYMADYHVELKPSCEICGSTKELERHHWRYDKPLLVNTLCRTCHKIQHVKNFPRWHECKLEADRILEVSLR
jgi:hypothetical protein